MASIFPGRRKKPKPSRVNSLPPIVSPEIGQGSNERGFTPNVVTDTNSVEIVNRYAIGSVAFLVDGEHLVSGNRGGKIRRWQVVDGKEVGKPMGTKGAVVSLAVSPDGKWLVSGTECGQVMLWDAVSHEDVAEFNANKGAVKAVDVSPEGRRIASGSEDCVVIWSASTGRQLLGPLKHDGEVVAVKFSPDGKHIATATRDSVRVYDSRDGRLLASFPVQVNSAGNGSFAWASDSERLFALSLDGNIHRLDVSETTAAKWSILSNNDPRCISLACNDTVIVASAHSSLSFWDAKTHQQLGSVITYSHPISCMAIAPTGDIATVHQNTIILRNLCGILPVPYCDDALQQLFMKQEISRLKTEKNDLEKTVHALRAQDSEDDIANLKKTIQELRDQLARSNQEKEGLSGINLTLLARDEDRKVIHLDESVQELRCTLAISQGAVNQLADAVGPIRADLGLEGTSSAQKVPHFERTIRELSNQFAACRCTLHVLDKKHECVTAYAQDRIFDAVHHLLDITNTMIKNLEHNKPILNWFKEFTAQCVLRLQIIGDEALAASKHEEALSAHSAILLLTSSPPKTVLTEWARMVLRRCSSTEALRAADKFKVSRFHIYRAVCEVLEGDDHVTEAIECFKSMETELSQETSTHDERSLWELDFRQRCIKKLEEGGDAAIALKNNDAAIGSYSSALSLHPANICGIIVKCCKARVGLLEDELVNVTKIIERDPSSYKGYKRKHAVLHSMGRYDEAFTAYQMMLSRIDKSPDAQTRQLRKGYLDTTPLIRGVVEQTIRDIPRVLIDTTTGRLYDKSFQAATFEKLSVFNELRSSMTTPDRLDYARIMSEVEKFYEYVMFSHKWQPEEPTFQMVENKSVYKLLASPTNSKLIHFCKLVRSRRFRWAWSDTCCVNQADKGIQQESVVAMFRWYHRAAFTIVHLLEVFSDSQKPGSLRWSIWNTRGWTYQEYVASKVIQFYTEDWKPYLDLKMFNHKESPIILAEMEQATEFATQALATLQPGLTRVREKLYLASKRKTTREEDIAYSLFGIFKVAIPIIYGEGNQAVGRLLEYTLSRSNNVTILAWTGVSGSHYSYLPSDLTVYDQIAPPHIPQPIEAVEIDRMVVEMQSSFPDSSPIVELYQRLHDLPPLSIDSSRLRLPGLVFPLTNLTPLSVSDPEYVHPGYRAMIPVLGDVRIETRDDLAEMKGLVLIHPWTSPVIDEDFSGCSPRFDLVMRALRLVIRLRQPFGALLLASQGRIQYRRVATDSFIKVQIRAETSLKELMESVRTVDIQ